MSVFDQSKARVVWRCCLLGPMSALMIAFGEPAGAFSDLALTPKSVSQPSGFLFLHGTGLLEGDNGAPVFDHGSFLARASANDSTGELRAYASSTQVQPAVPRVPYGATAVPTVSGSVFLVGPSGPVGLTIQMEFEGRFLGPVAANSLTGILTVADVSAEVGPAWGSTLVFSEMPSAAGVLAEGSSVRSTPTVLELPFPQGTPVVLSDTRDHLSGRVLVPLTVTPGVSLHIGATMIALHSAIGLSGEVEGATDAFGTGRISFIVPDGYALVGEDGAFSALLPVPEPGPYVLMIVGLALVGCAARRRIR